ncbi:hypothetical protein ICNINCKA_00092 [Synechococcus sp. CBW1107]|nr:hypothetical protein ICNINCKA_00092 [Synechococcus sp. CBW1107]
MVSNAHKGLTNAIRQMLQGSCCQRCRVHFARNLLQRVPKAHQGMVTVFGWIKAFGGLRQFKLRGIEKVGAVFVLHLIAYNLIRLGNILKPAMVAA